MRVSQQISLSLLLIAFLLADCSILVSQDINELNFVNYTKQQGLSNNNITGIAQDSTGFIWITTASGLDRFNGKTFVQYHSNDDSASLPQENLTGLVWLDKQRLAVYSLGLHIINTRTGEYRNLFIPYGDKQYQYKFNNVRSVTGNSAGDIFVLTYSGFYHYDKNYRLVFRFDIYPPGSVKTEFYSFGRKLLWLDAHTLMITSLYGIYQYDTEKRLFKKMEVENYPLLKEFLNYPEKDYSFFQPLPGSLFIMKSESDTLVYLNLTENKITVSRLPFHKLGEQFDYRSDMFAISDTLLYVTGNLSGFYKMRFYPATGQVKFDPDKYFPSCYCNQIMNDRNHNLWLATNKGVFRQNNFSLYIGQVPLPQNLQAHYPNMSISDIHPVNDKLYVSTRGEGGILIFDRQKLEYEDRIDFTKIYRHPSAIYTIENIDNRTLLAATSGPLCAMDAQTNRITEIIPERWDRETHWPADLCKDREGNIWIAGENIYKFDHSKRLFTVIAELGSMPLSRIRKAQHIRADASGNIWMAGHGLIRYNTSANRFDRFIDSFPFIKIPDKQVNTFVADSLNNLWINSNNNGLICYNTEKGATRYFTTDNGLPDNNIADMIIIGNKLWIATFSGIACLDMKTFQINSFGTEDGLPDIPVSPGARFFYDAEINRLFIGFTNTIVEINPDIMTKKSPLPRLFIESITAGNQERTYLPRNDFTTSWRNNEITVTIGSINFINSKTQHFAYRMMGNDDSKWMQLGEQNTFSIADLSPGFHRIQVKLFSVSNRWPEQIREIKVNILPPFWKQKWFMLLAMIAILVSGYLFFRWRTGIIRTKERAKTHLQELKAAEYKNQFELEQISNYFSSSLADKEDVDEVLWDVAKNLIGRMNYVDCMIYVWNKDKTKMIQKASYGPKGTPQAIQENVFDVSPGQGVVGYVMVTKEPVMIPDTRKDARYRVDDIFRLSEICVPIIHDDELIGIIDSEHHEVNHYKERDIKILTTVATLVANKIKNIESKQSLALKQNEIAFINQQLAEAQLSALQTQMNPHFIFNSLNSIKRMILNNEQQNASKYLSKFAQMIRITLHQSKELFTTVQENVEYLESYLMMEKLRFDDSFTFRIIVDDQIDKEELLIPTLMIQPLAENAIWHGLMCKEGEKRLLVRFSQQGETIACTIRDNGIGIKKSEALKQLNHSGHQSLGLGNLRNRINIMNEKYNAGCSLEISDLGDSGRNKSGTCAVLRFNLFTQKPGL